MKLEYLGSQSIREKDDESIAKPLKGSTIEMVRIEEKLEFKFIVTLSSRVKKQNPRIVYYEKQLNVAKLVNSVDKKENIMLICRTTNPNIFFGLYSEKPICKKNFIQNDSSFFMFVTNKKELYCFMKNMKSGPSLMICDRKANKIIDTEKCFYLFFEVTNAFMNTKVLKCSFDKDLHKHYQEVEGKELPFKIGNSISYEVLSVYAVQWN